MIDIGFLTGLCTPQMGLLKTVSQPCRDMVRRLFGLRVSPSFVGLDVVVTGFAKVSCEILLGAFGLEPTVLRRTVC